MTFNFSFETQKRVLKCVGYSRDFVITVNVITELQQTGFKI